MPARCSGRRGASRPRERGRQVFVCEGSLSRLPFLLEIGRRRPWPSRLRARACARGSVRGAPRGGEGVGGAGLRETALNADIADFAEPADHFLRPSLSARLQPPPCDSFFFDGETAAACFPAIGRQGWGVLDKKGKENGKGRKNPRALRNPLDPRFERFSPGSTEGRPQAHRKPARRSAESGMPVAHRCRARRFHRPDPEGSPCLPAPIIEIPINAPTD